MKKVNILVIFFFYCLNLNAWWDPGHLVTAMIAYMNLDEPAKKRVDELTKNLQRDYPYINHFVTTGPWPDDLKAEGVRTYDTWHYTNIPLNNAGVALPDKQQVDVIWAINQMVTVLKSSRPRDVDRARHLGFLVHFVGDIHQPLHSTSVHDNNLPAGNVGGNSFPLKGNWRNLHQLWDDGCGYLSSYNDINPYGKKKEPLTREDIKRLEDLAKEIMKECPKEDIVGIELTDSDFWALESHKLAIRYGYQGVNGKDERGRRIFLQPNGTPSETYLENGQKVVKERLAAAGYRLAALLNDIYRE